MGKRALTTLLGESIRCTRSIVEEQKRKLDKSNFNKFKTIKARNVHAPEL
jgi:hypothetical protein